MTPETLTALKASIAHHEGNLKAEWPQQVQIGWRSCALCVIHRVEEPGAVVCNGCPVKARTGRNGCMGSPYDRVESSLSNWSINSEQKPAFLAAERAEITFLRSLLPEETSHD